MLVLLQIIHGTVFLAKFLGLIFLFVLAKPAYFIARIFFYQVAVRLYYWYRQMVKLLGLEKFGDNILAFMFHQRMVHVLVIFITSLLIFINLSSKTRAGGFSDMAGNTILASLISSELDSEYKDDSQLVVETFDMESEISMLQQSYLDNLGAFRVSPQALIGEADEESEEMPASQNFGSLLKPDLASTQMTKRAREGIVTHQVAPGDTVSTIAEEYEVSVSTILWENNLNAYSIIRPGDKLAILPTTGISHLVKNGENISKIAKNYSVDEEKIIDANKLADGSLQAGQKLIIPGGVKAAYAAYAPKTYTGFEAIKNIIKAPNAKPAAGNKMNWPTSGKRISQYYSWRHYAIDIANKTGTPLYAADAGTVEVAGWGTGYGNQIVIDHGGGRKTRYAHCSKFYVSKGDKVSKGQVIAAMGNTGWSTGPHLHFEVIINGAKVNPLSYVK